METTRQKQLKMIIQIDRHKVQQGLFKTKVWTYLALETHTVQNVGAWEKLSPSTCSVHICFFQLLATTGDKILK